MKISKLFNKSMNKAKYSALFVIGVFILVLFLDDNKSSHSMLEKTIVRPLRNPHVASKGASGIIKATSSNKSKKGLSLSPAQSPSKTGNLSVAKNQKGVIYYIQQPNDNKSGDDDDVIQKRAHVRNMMKTAWDVYSKYAWGYDEVRPESKSVHDRHGSRIPMGTSIIDAMDTLYIMGLEEEFQKGRNWIMESFDFDRVHEDVSVFETSIRFVGGLLSAYALTGDDIFKKKALHVVDKLLPAFNTGSGLPYGMVNMRTGRSRNGWKGQSILSEFGTLSMEFTYLSDITGDKKYVNTIEKMQDVIEKYNHDGKKDCSFPLFWNTESGIPTNSHTSLGAFGDSFFEYLIKEWRRSGFRDTRVKDMFYKASSGMRHSWTFLFLEFH